jgi:hypothetical protein
VLIYGQGRLRATVGLRGSIGGRIGEREVRIVERHVDSKKHVVSEELIKRFAARSTKASAQLERRTLPDGYRRSAKVERFLAERRSHG